MNIGKFIRFIPIVVAVVIIAALTLQYTPRNVEMSEKFRIALVGFCSRLGLDSSTAWWNSGSGIRKLGHIIEYGILGTASTIAFFDSHRVIKGVLISMAFCVAVSVVDQVVKIFVPIRHFDVMDLPFDAVGSVLGIIFITVVGVMISKGV